MDKKGNEKREEKSGAIDREAVMSVSLDFEQGRTYGHKSFPAGQTAKILHTNGRMEGRTDRRSDGRTDGQTDEHTLL